MIDILVPLGRPRHVKRVVANIRSATQVDHTILFICSTEETDGIAAVRKEGLEPLVEQFPSRGAYACKINAGYRATSNPWILCGADDLDFHILWDVAALKEGDRTGAGVVGTQDKGNPLVKVGKHATHPLVRRSYIAEHGGTFDEGCIYSEAYDHQFVDTELVQVAMLRGQWTFAHQSVIEHRHPHWGKADDDDVYAKAVRATGPDRRLHVQRMCRFKTLLARERQRR